MDICAYSNKSVCENVSHFGTLPGNLPDCADNSAEDFDVDDLGNHLSKFVIVQEGQELSDKTAQNLSKDDASENTPDSHLESMASKKCLVKYATFPCSSKSTSPNELIQKEKEQMSDVTAEHLVPNGDANSAQLPSRSKSLPSARELVSALKGSREKHGIAPKKLSVKWAANVYDPVPTSVSHVPNNKPQRHRNDGKKNGRNKQKNSGKSSRANKGKDKKHSRKYGGSSKRGLYPLDENIIVVSSCELPTTNSTVDLGIDNPAPDPFCGSSFLKNSITKLHFPIAEAT